ncbi:MAG: DotU family type IV/VI secretion system protein [Planctomycetota bacterium]|jgi:type VI secretion system protein ImpK
MRLTDCFMGLIAYTVYFQRTVAVKQPNYEEVRNDVLRLLTQSEDCFKKGSFSQEDYDQARFVICAWVDEVILNSGWDKKSQWQKEQLQRVYYNTAGAGEEVFERLNNLGLHQRDVREVYYFCLALGFVGRYCNKGDDVLLEQLKTSNIKLLMGSSVGLPSLEMAELFPGAYPTETAEMKPQKQKFSFSIPAIICMVAPPCLFGVLFLIYRFALSGAGENILKVIP